MPNAESNDGLGRDADVKRRPQSENQDRTTWWENALKALTPALVAIVLAVSTGITSGVENVQKDISSLEQEVSRNCFATQSVAAAVSAVASIDDELATNRAAKTLIASSLNSLRRINCKSP